jgi:peptidoglycan/LPS O-acetylase OafA/YrhL
MTAVSDVAAPPAAPTDRLPYQPALDGLRALAVGAVVAYHLGWHDARGGYLGVDAFFVLSGFLITSLLLNERRHRHTIRLRQFWSRRARRLLPAVLTLVAVVTVYVGTRVPSYQLGQLRGDALAGIFYVANWHFITNGVSYFAITTGPSPFQHLWSLAIEEQFYALWPLVVAAVFWRARRPVRLLLVIAVVGTLLSQLVMMLWYRAADPSAAYFATPARLNTLLTGCGLAILLARAPAAARLTRAGATTLSAVALAAIGGAWIAFEPTRTFYFGGDTIFGLLVAVLIFSLQAGRNDVARVLSLRPIVWLGTISYGIYLWHWPIIQYGDFGRVGLHGNAASVAAVVVTIVIAAISSRLIEWPVRRSRVPVLRWVLPATAVAVAVALAGTSGASSVPRFLNQQPGIRPCAPAEPSELRAARSVFRTHPFPSVPRLRGQRIGILGDSRACSLATGLEAAAPRIGARVQNGAVLGCGVVARTTILDGGFLPLRLARQCAGKSHRALRNVRGADVIVVWSAWEGQDFGIRGRRVRAGTPEHDRILRARLESWLARDLPRHAQIAMLLTAIPAVDPATLVDPTVLQDLPHLNSIYREFAATHSKRVHVLDMPALLCPAGPPCPPEISGIHVRADGEHLSAEGSGFIAEWLLPQLATLVRRH